MISEPVTKGQEEFARFDVLASMEGNRLGRSRGGMRRIFMLLQRHSTQSRMNQATR